MPPRGQNDAFIFEILYYKYLCKRIKLDVHINKLVLKNLGMPVWKMTKWNKTPKKMKKHSEKHQILRDLVIGYISH